MTPFLRPKNPEGGEVELRRLGSTRVGRRGCDGSLEGPAWDRWERHRTGAVVVEVPMWLLRTDPVLAMLLILDMAY